MPSQKPYEFDFSKAEKRMLVDQFFRRLGPAPIKPEDYDLYIAVAADTLKKLFPELVKNIQKTAPHSPVYIRGIPRGFVSLKFVPSLNKGGPPQWKNTDSVTHLGFHEDTGGLIDHDMHAPELASEKNGARLRQALDKRKHLLTKEGYSTPYTMERAYVFSAALLYLLNALPSKSGTNINPSGEEHPFHPHPHNYAVVFGVRGVNSANTRVHTPEHYDEETHSRYFNRPLQGGEVLIIPPSALHMVDGFEQQVKDDKKPREDKKITGGRPLVRVTHAILGDQNNPPPQFSTEQIDEGRKKFLLPPHVER